jgi:RNA polymerase sigma-70 factor (ECF subfamily)
MAEAIDAAPLLRSGPVEAPAVSGDDVVGRRRADRVRVVVRAHYASLWRWLRRLGVPEAAVEDVAQQALFVFAQRIDDVEHGREKTFLFGVALRVAYAARREHRRWRDAGDDRELAELPAPAPDAAQQLDDRRARALLDALLESMPFDQRSVFILHELEEMTMAEIARTLDIPAGTVASRLRRARETFEALSRRAQAQAAFGGRSP